ncbi:MAG: hypothetical protein ABI587_09225 [Gemmatimonadales bacterium]
METESIEAGAGHGGFFPTRGTFGRRVKLFAAVTGKEFSLKYRFATSWQDSTSSAPQPT